MQSNKERKRVLCLKKKTASSSKVPDEKPHNSKETTKTEALRNASSKG